MNQHTDDTSNPYSTPKARSVHESTPIGHFVGFGPRLGAVLIDLIWMFPLSLGIAFFYVGTDGLFDPDRPQSLQEQLMTNLLLGAVVVAFWMGNAATPGKMALKMKIVDYKTGNAPSIGQSIGRYFAYIPSGLILGIGYLSVLWDSENRSWHDKLSGTAVVER